MSGITSNVSRRGNFTDFRQGDLLVGRPSKPDGLLYLERRDQAAEGFARPYRTASFSLEQCVVLVLSPQLSGRDAWSDSEVLVSDFRRRSLQRGWMSNYCLMNDFWLA